MIHMSVSSQGLSIRHCTVTSGDILTDDFLGWVKEQSLRGIVDWFNLWLGQESSIAN